MADGQVTLACALASEERAARRGGAHAVRVGIGAHLPLPAGPLASFGVAGALVPGVEPGTLLTARRIVNEGGAVLWEGEPLPVPGAAEAVICSARRVVDAPSEREQLAARTGAVAVEMESERLAATGRLAGTVRAIADGPERPLGGLARAATAGGGVAWRGVIRAFITEPRHAPRAARASIRALASLERAATAISGERPHGR